MASNGQGLRIIIQILLGVVIVVLAYFLYVSITAPWDAVEQEREVTRLTRVQMSDVRNAIIRYEREEDRFPSTLDSLVIWMKTDSFTVANLDSLFRMSFNPDSMLFSPRSGSRFLYTLNDTGRVHIYMLKDPDSDDQIGSEIPDVTQLNASSWE